MSLRRVWFAHTVRARATRLEAFARFVHRKGWRTAPRAPTSARYVALFAKAKGAPIDGRGGGWHTLTRVVRVSG